MISLSRIIKSAWTNSEAHNLKRIEIKTLKIDNHFDCAEEMMESAFNQEELDLIYLKANEEAEQIVQNAKQEAEIIRMQVEEERNHWFQTERVKLEEDARQLGYSEGHEVSMQQGYEEMHEHIKQAQNIVDLAKRDYREYLDSSEKIILELSVEIARKILNAEVAANQEGFYHLVRKAIKEAKEYSDIRLRIHYSKYETILAQKDELMAIFPKETDFHIYPDDELDETSCVIESSNGRMDASIDSQLQEIKRKLLELVEGE